MSEDLHTLVGVYALDALEPLERRRFEAHLDGCVTCAIDVEGLTATAALLASAVAEAPPAGLRAQVLAQVAETRQDPPVVRPHNIRRVSRLGRVFMSVAAATLLVVGVVALTTRGGGSSVPGELASLVAAPDAQLVDLRDQSTDLMMRVVWSPSAGKGAVVANGLADPGAGHTYQMWAIGADGPQPAGLLEPDDKGELVATMDLDLAGAAMVGVTVEPAGGSPKPTTTVLASGTV